jgi:hypothetical protein
MVTEYFARNRYCRERPVARKVGVQQQNSFPAICVPIHTEPKRFLGSPESDQSNNADGVASDLSIKFLPESANTLPVCTA